MNSLVCSKMPKNCYQNCPTRLSLALIDFTMVLLLQPLRSDSKYYNLKTETEHVNSIL